MVDLDKVKGFDRLDSRRQEVFKSTYINHCNCMSGWMKEKWVPRKVEKADYGVKVTMKNGKDWFHYNWIGEWY